MSAKLLVLWAIVVVPALGVRILAYFPFPLRSHHKIFQPILAELAARGHRVTYVSPFAMEDALVNVTHVSTKHLVDLNVIGRVGFLKYKIPTVWRQMQLLGTLGEMIFDETLKTDEVRNLLDSNESFDVVLHGLFCQEHAAIFQHKFNALGITILTFGDNSWVNELSGLPDNPSFMMNFFSQLSDDMDFFERLRSLYTLTLSTAMSYYNLNRIQAKVNQAFTFDKEVSLLDLISDQALILSHSHHAVGYPFPTSPNVKQIGGIAITPTGQLDEDLDKFMNESSHGVIYFSLGSTTQMSKIFSDKMRNDFSNAFRRMKQRVLWKWEGQPWDDVPINVKLSPWFPQSDVLAHKNVKVFITQGGLLSLFETVHYQVPTVVLPLFGDQGKNAKFITTSQIGVGLDFSTLTEESIREALNQAIDNKKFKSELVKRSNLLKDSPKTPLNEAVHWIEYVIKHGKVLQSKGARLPFYQLHGLDVLACLLVSTLLCGAVCWKMVPLTVACVKNAANRSLNCRNTKEKLKFL